MAKKIQVAFCKASHGSILNKTVKVMPDSKYTHVELIVGNYWYGSINKFGGVGITKTRTPKIDVNEWDIVDIDISDDVFNNIVRTANILVGSGNAYARSLTQQLAKEDIVFKEDLLSAQVITYILKKYGLLTDDLNLPKVLTSKTNYVKNKSPMDKFLELEIINFSVTEVYFIW